MKRIYVPLPDAEARHALIVQMMAKHVKGGGTEVVTHDKTVLARIVHRTQGYSGSDLTAVLLFSSLYCSRDEIHCDLFSTMSTLLSSCMILLFSTKVCKEAAMGPIREISPLLLRTLKAEEVRPIHEEVKRPFIRP